VKLGNWPLEVQLGSTNSKGLPGLLQVSHQSLFPNGHCLPQCAGSRWCVCCQLHCCVSMRSLMVVLSFKPCHPSFRVSHAAAFRVPLPTSPSPINQSVSQQSTINQSTHQPISAAPPSTAIQATCLKTSRDLQKHAPPSCSHKQIKCGWDSNIRPCCSPVNCRSLQTASSDRLRTGDPI